MITRSHHTAVIVAIIVAFVLVIYPDVVFAEEDSVEVTFQGNEELQPAFTLYVLHKGLPYRVTAPQTGDTPWPTLRLYKFDSVTLISHKDKEEGKSCSNRVIRIKAKQKGVDWEIPFKSVVGCESIRWENKAPIKIPADF